MEFDFKTLGIKEVTAIELKYLGNQHKAIALKLDVPVLTVDEWFKDRGKLGLIYADYRKFMNDERLRATRASIVESDENILMQTTNVMRQYAKNLAEKDHIKDKVTMKDYFRAWQIQRIQQNKPTSYEKSEVTNITHEDIINSLGLTNEDFEDANIEQTKLRIAGFIQERELGEGTSGKSSPEA